MSWRAVVAALDADDTFRSRVSVYRHPLAGRPILWHVVRTLLSTTPAPSAVRVLHRADIAVDVGETDDRVTYEPVPRGDEAVALRAAVTHAGLTILVDGAAPLLAPSTLARLLRVGEGGIATLHQDEDHAPRVAVAGEGPALGSADDPRHPRGAALVEPTSSDECLRVADRHALAVAGVVLRDRLVRQHQRAGVNFLLPATVWIDVDVRIGADTVIYPGAVLEGATDIGAECVIGPYSRLVEATVGRGAELRGWNYVSRTAVRNHAVMEPYVRRGVD